ncbi:MAG: MoaD/ThiS family protein [Acidimicrobiia bacterium]
MATVRLFANLREIAGVSRVEIPGDTVRELLSGASRRFGPAFEESLRHARVWRNGETAELSDPVEPSDEVALLPPVSGGADTMIRSSGELQSLVILIAVGALVVGDVAGPAWWAASVVGVAAVWAVDLLSVAAARARDIPIVPLFVSILAGALGAHALGPIGLGLALVVAVMVPLGWGLASDSNRILSVLAPGLLLSVLVAGATGSLVLTRGGLAEGARVVGIFLAMTTGATLVAWLISRYSRIPYLDPFSAGALVVIVIGVALAITWELDVVAFLLTGIGVAVAVIAGRGLGSLVRIGQVSLIEPPPGTLAGLDGPVAAAAIFYPLLALVG